jgi:hypothetical protein
MEKICLIVTIDILTIQVLHFKFHYIENKIQSVDFQSCTTKNESRTAFGWFSPAQQIETYDS